MNADSALSQQDNIRRLPEISATAPTNGNNWSEPEISREVIMRQIKTLGGSGAPADEGLERLPAYAEISLRCKRGHCWKTMVSCISEWCTICEILQPMHKFDSKIRCAQSDYDLGQTKFEFVCSVGHRFIASSRNCKKGCRSCVLLEIARRKHKVTYALSMDCLGLYIHEDSRLRFHCNKVRHNPRCDNPDCIAIRGGNSRGNYEFSPKCRNFVPCGQDFYATPRQIKYSDDVYCCKNNHRWNFHREIFNTVRLFEVQFGCRFDDDVSSANIEFTGYNRDLALAFIHSADKISSKYLSSAKKWCATNNVQLVHISADVVRASSLAVEIARQLFELGRLGDLRAQTTVTRLRTKIHEMDRDNKLFEDRCII